MKPALHLPSWSALLIFFVFLPRAVIWAGVSLGTGFFIGTDGYLVTNHHVIKGAEKVEVLFEGEWRPARVVRADEVNDLALLKASGKEFSCIALDFSPDVRPGDPAFTIGFPDPSVLGFSPKTNRGEVSALSGLRDDIRYYQITVAIQPGNSGGPLCDDSGAVIGVTTASVNAINRLQNAGYVPQNINFAVKSSYLRPLLEAVPGLLQSPVFCSPFRAKRNQRPFERRSNGWKTRSSPSKLTKTSCRRHRRLR